MTNIICCPVAHEYRPETAKALALYAPECEIRMLNVNDRFAYSDAIRELWFGGEDLIVIEQDIEITADTIPSFEACSQPWCTFEYELFSGYMINGSLGCTKFSAECQRLTQICAVRWQLLDMSISNHLRHLGLRPHVHGEVKHHHPYEEQLSKQELQRNVDRMIANKDRWDNEQSLRPCGCFGQPVTFD